MLSKKASPPHHKMCGYFRLKWTECVQKHTNTPYTISSNWIKLKQGLGGSGAAPVEGNPIPVGLFKGRMDGASVHSWVSHGNRDSTRLTSVPRADNVAHYIFIRRPTDEC